MSFTVLPTSLEFAHSELESHFQRANHKMAQSGVVLTSSIYLLFTTTLLIFNIIFDQTSISSLLPPIGCILGAGWLRVRYDTLKINQIRVVGYVVHTMVAFHTATAEIFNPISHIAFETCTMFLTSIFLIRNFRFTKYFLTIVATVESIALFLRFSHFDSRPITQAIAYYCLFMTFWLYSLLLFTYHVEKEFRASFLLKHQIQSMLDQERLIFSKLSTALLLLHEGLVKWKNPACDAIFDKQPLELHERVGYNWLKNDVNLQLQAWLEECCRNKEDRSGKFVYSDGNPDPNHSKHLQVVASWITREGEKELLLLVTDRTAEEDATKFKYKWLSTVSHEFRTPLNVICNMIDVLQPEPTLSDTAREFLKLAESSVCLLKVYVSDLVDYCLLRNNRFFLSSKLFDIFSLIRNCTKMLHVKAQDREVAINLNFGATEEWRVINNDSSRIQQVLINLLGNAIKFTKKKGKISISTSLGENKNELQVSVADSGIGIREEDQKKLFTEYGRVIDDQTLLLNPQGVGLGLWICKQFCDEIGSGIFVLSEYGKGTTFTFSVKNFEDTTSNNESPNDSHEQDSSSEEKVQLPFDSRSLSDQTERRNARPKMEQTGRSNGDSQPMVPRPSFTEDNIAKDLQTSCPILVVDDEPVNRFIVKNFCDRLNIPVIDASDGASAFQIIQSSLRQLPNNSLSTQLPFRMIVLDYQMPQMSGPELLRKLKVMADEKNLVLPPVVGYTALISKQEQDIFLESGAIGMLEKPTTFDKFCSLISKHIPKV